MTLFWFCLGIILITLIARYNESNKLFWTLLLAFTMGFAGTKMVIDTIGTKPGKVKLTQVDPTQVSTVTPGSLVYLLADDSLETVKKAISKPVSQDTPAIREQSSTQSKVLGAQDQWMNSLPNPPTDTIMYDTS